MHGVAEDVECDVRCMEQFDKILGSSLKGRAHCFGMWECLWGMLNR